MTAGNNMRGYLVYLSGSTPKLQSVYRDIPSIALFPGLDKTKIKWYRRGMYEQGSEVIFNHRESSLAGVAAIDKDMIPEVLIDIHARSGMLFALASVTTPQTEGQRIFNAAVDLDTFGKRLANYLPPIADAEYDSLLDGDQPA
jgi:hypothetical protein